MEYYSNMNRRAQVEWLSPPYLYDQTFEISHDDV